MNEADVKYLEQPAELDEASKLLLKAADAIESRGLHKNGLCADVYGECKGAVCARGALLFAANGSPIDWTGWSDDTSPLAVADGRLAAAVGFVERAQMPHWNNAPERTAEEVISKMRAVALGE